MTPTSLKKLIKKLSTIGLESIDSILPKNRLSSFNDHMGSLCLTLLNLKGEASSVAIAEEIIRAYQEAGFEEKEGFFQYLYHELAPNEEALQTAIDNYLKNKSQQSLLALSKAAESPRQELFRALNMPLNGTQALIKMREDLLKPLSKHPELKIIDQDLLHLFKSWFNRGFLQLRRIDWQTPAAVLEKLIEYESVHEIRGWPDLRRRLENDRRCFAFFHPVIPDVPLIFVEVALTREISGNVISLLNQARPEDDDDNYSTAIFYSINNCLEGLRGVSFGNFLIKQVVGNLAAEIPSIKTYSTLSPVPRFLEWLEKNHRQLEFLSLEQQKLLADFLQADNKKLRLEEESGLEDLMVTLCAYYLLKAKSRDKPADPVARFHLGNGARMERINWGADLSDNGIKQSAGIMVNYLYDPKTLTRNHEAYEQDNAVICANSVNKLLPQK